MSATNLCRLAIAVSMLICSVAEAQVFRAYLASGGNDANACTLQAPCRLLPAALNAVAGGGEIWMLDSANYNTATVNVNKSVSILAVPGAVGSVVALGGGPAIEITANDLTVALRNLVIGPVAGATAGTYGVRVTGASNVTIERSLIANLPDNGVFLSGTSTLKITQTTVRNNGGYAIRLHNGARAAISSTQMLGNAQGGVLALGSTPSTTTTASVSDSVISGGTYGLVALTQADAVTRVSMTRTTIHRAATAALNSQTTNVGQAEINVGGSLIIDNGNAWIQQGTGSTVLSLGNNQMSGNAGSVGSKTPLVPQ